MSKRNSGLIEYALILILVAIVANGTLQLLNRIVNIWGLLIRAAVFLLGVGMIYLPFRPEWFKTYSRDQSKQPKPETSSWRTGVRPSRPSYVTRRERRSSDRQDDRSRKRRLPLRYYLGFWGIGGFLVVLSLWMGRWSIYQCAFTTPDEIKFVGHIVDPNEARPNNYLVLLFLENEEIGRDITRLGGFSRSGEGRDDGYFEIVVDNSYKLTRCDSEAPLRQYSYHGGFLGCSRTLCLWHYFSDLEVGSREVVPVGEKGVSYTLAVLPNSGTLPDALSRSGAAYLTDIGEVVISMPLTVRNEEGGLQQFTEDLCITLGLCQPESAGEYQAWVKDFGEDEILELGEAGIDVLDIDNCSGAGPVISHRTRTHIYSHKFEFQVNAGVDIPFGVLVPTLGATLGFAHGQIDTEEAHIEVNVPASRHTRYEIVWQEIWRTGTMRVNNVLTDDCLDVPFRARAGMQWTVTSHNQACGSESD